MHILPYFDVSTNFWMSVDCDRGLIPRRLILVHTVYLSQSVRILKNDVKLFYNPLMPMN